MKCPICGKRIAVTPGKRGAQLRQEIRDKWEAHAKARHADWWAMRRGELGAPV